MKKVLLVLTLTLPGLCHAQQPKPTATSRPALTEAEKKTLEQFIMDLDSGNPKTIYEAFVGLAHMGPKAVGAIDALTRKLDGSRMGYKTWEMRTGYREFHVGVMAVRGLRSIGKPALGSLIGALSKKDNDIVRTQAALAMASLRLPIALKHWLALLKDSNRYIRLIAIRQVGKSKDPLGVAPLTKLLKKGNKEMRVAAIEALGNLGTEKAIDCLIAYLPHAASLNENAPGIALARIGRPAIQAIIQRFDKIPGQGTRIAVYAIRNCDARAVKDLLVQCLDSKHGDLREAGLYAMLKDKIPEAFKAARGLTDDSYWEARYTAARCLGTMADKKTADSVMPILLKMASTDNHTNVRRQAIDSAAALPAKAPPEAWKVVQKLLKDDSRRVQESALQATRKFWSPELIPSIMPLFKNDNSWAQAGAAYALGFQKVKEAIPKLTLMLNDPNSHRAGRAAYALMLYKSDETLNLLIAKVKDRTSSNACRLVTAEALCYAKNPKTIDALIVALKDNIDPSSTRIASTLKSITGQNFWYDHAKWRAWYEQQKKN